MTEFDPASRTKLYVDVALDFTPTGSTIELKIDATWYPVTWQGAPVQVESVWEQTGLTDGYFAGPDAPLGPAVLLSRASHPTQVRVTSGTQITVSDCEALHVR